MRLRWQKIDYRLGRKMTIWQQIKYNFSLPWWRLLGKLAMWGFITTPQGQYLTLRDFSLRRTRNLLNRERERAATAAICLENKYRLDIEAARYEGYVLALNKIKQLAGIEDN